MGQEKAVAMDWAAAEALASRITAAWGMQEPGGAIIGFTAKGVVFASAGGVESLATRTPFSPDSVVRYASITKHIFCSLLLQLQHVVRLDDRLGDHLPELQRPLADVTIGRALDMTGGLPDVRECLTLLGLSVYTDTQADRLIEFLASLTRLNFPAGTEISYSNSGYRLVEAILARKGILFRDLLQQKIATPLGIEISAPDLWHDAVPGLVPGYWHNGQKWQLGSAGLQLSASGCLTGSALSLTKWVQSLMTGSHGFATTLAELNADRPLLDGRVTDYGLGLRRNEIGGRLCLGHGGSLPGYKSYFLFDPQTQTGFVLVTNREDVDSYGTARDCMAALHQLALPQKSTAIPDGLYVEDEGALWLEMRAGTANIISADDTLYDCGNGIAASLQASSPVTLQWDGGRLTGEIGYRAANLAPVIAQTTDDSLDGDWLAADYDAHLRIAGGRLSIGIGPIRQTVPLKNLGGGRYLFELQDGPWSKTVCLNRLSADHFELVISRARMIEYKRV